MTLETNQLDTNQPNTGQLRTVTTVGGVATATVVAPAADDPPDGGVIVVHDARGITPYLTSVCELLAQAGWLAVAPHLYHRDGIAEVDPTGGWPSAGTQMGTLTGPGIMADTDACLAHLADNGFGPERTAVIGFCMGGTVALLTATRHAMGAAVSFYGGGVSTPYWDGVAPLLDIAPSLRTPWLGLYGVDDALISQAEIEALRAAATTAAVPTMLISYPGAGHAFHSHDRAAVHRPEAAQDAWNRTLDWLRRSPAGVG
ncbi:dienelactone hydrolase family protein [Frankia sp. Cas4]|uniref:dienelactone hydrolase family protein n=1 Tax=Frankia sp. Cas4 TaxID=3073927 RepID=UPI002AD4BA7D|nr:dienelactone hydrolase family protein [Frankia sp. Cas4]